MKPSGAAEAFPPSAGAILGHQGGWDEILLVVGPLAIVGLLLWLANKRVAAQLEQQGASTEGDHQGKEAGPKR